VIGYSKKTFRYFLKTSHFEENIDLKIHSGCLLNGGLNKKNDYYKSKSRRRKRKKSKSKGKFIIIFKNIRKEKRKPKNLFLLLRTFEKGGGKTFKNPERSVKKNLQHTIFVFW
jgi:hypothetical protein